MAGLIPFNRRTTNLPSRGFENFYNMLDDFFSESGLSSRNLMRDTFKIDVKETEGEYSIEAELPGVSKDEIDLNLTEGVLGISIKREENINENNDNYIHRERRLSSMSRSIRLADAKPDGINARLENGVLTIVVPKQEKANKSFKIDID